MCLFIHHLHLLSTRSLARRSWELIEAPHYRRDFFITEKLSKQYDYPIPVGANAYGTRSKCHEFLEYMRVGIFLTTASPLTVRYSKMRPDLHINTTECATLSRQSRWMLRRSTQQNSTELQSLLHIGVVVQWGHKSVPECVLRLSLVLMVLCKVPRRSDQRLYGLRHTE